MDNDPRKDLPKSSTSEDDPNLKIVDMESYQQMMDDYDNNVLCDDIRYKPSPSRDDKFQLRKDVKSGTQENEPFKKETVEVTDRSITNQQTLPETDSNPLHFVDNYYDLEEKNRDEEKRKKDKIIFEIESNKKHIAHKMLDDRIAMELEDFATANKKLRDDLKLMKSGVVLSENKTNSQETSKKFDEKLPQTKKGPSGTSRKSDSSYSNLKTPADFSLNQVPTNAGEVRRGADTKSESSDFVYVLTVSDEKREKKQEISKKTEINTQSRGSDCTYTLSEERRKQIWEECKKFEEKYTKGFSSTSRKSLDENAKSDSLYPDHDKKVKRMSEDSKPSAETPARLSLIQDPLNICDAEREADIKSENSDSIYILPDPEEKREKKPERSKKTEQDTQSRSLGCTYTLSEERKKQIREDCKKFEEKYTKGFSSNSVKGLEENTKADSSQADHDEKVKRMSEYSKTSAETPAQLSLIQDPLNICDAEREADIKSENSDSIYVLPDPEEKREKKLESSKKTEQNTQSRSLGCTYTLSEERKKQIREDCKKFEEKYTKGVSSNSGKRLEQNATSDSSCLDHDEKVKRMSEYSKPCTETPAQISLIQDPLNICDAEREADIKSENSDSIYVLPDPEEKREKKQEISNKTEEDTQSRSLGCTYTLSEERRKQIREDCKKFEEKYTKGVSSNSGKRLEQNATSDSSCLDHDEKVKRMSEYSKPCTETPAQISLIQDPLNICDAEREADIKSENSDSIYVLPDPEEKREKKPESSKKTEEDTQSRSLGCTYTLSEERRKQIREDCKKFEEKYTKGVSSNSGKRLEQNATSDSSCLDHDEKVKRMSEYSKPCTETPAQISLIQDPLNICDAEREADIKSETSDSIYVLPDPEEKREKKQEISNKTEEDTQSRSLGCTYTLSEERRKQIREDCKKFEEKYTKGISSNSGKRLEQNETSDSSCPDHDKKVKRMSEYSKPSTETPAQISLIQDPLNICDAEREADIKSENSDSIYVLPDPEEKREKKPESSKKTEEDTQSRSLGCTYTLSEERRKQIREDCKKFEEKYTKGVSSNSGKRLEQNATSDSSCLDHDEKVKRMSEYSKPCTETPAQISLIQDPLNICDAEREADIKSENSDSIYVLPDPEEKREKKPESSKKTEEDTQSRSLGCTYTLSEERRKQIREDCKKFEEKYTKGVSSNSGKRLEQNATSDSSCLDHDEKVKRMSEYSKPCTETPAQISLIQDPLNICDAEREADIKSENSDSIYVLPDPEEKREKKPESSKKTEEDTQSRSLGCTYTLSEERRKQIREDCKKFEEKYTKGVSSNSGKRLEQNATSDSSCLDHDEKVKRMSEYSKPCTETPAQISLIQDPLNICDAEREADIKSENSDSIYVLPDPEEKREKKPESSKKTEEDTQSRSLGCTYTLSEERRKQIREDCKKFEEKYTKGVSSNSGKRLEQNATSDSSCLDHDEKVKRMSEYSKPCTETPAQISLIQDPLNICDAEREADIKSENSDSIYVLPDPEEKREKKPESSKKTEEDTQSRSLGCTYTLSEERRKQIREDCKKFEEKYTKGVSSNSGKRLEQNATSDSSCLDHDEKVKRMSEYSKPSTETPAQLSLIQDSLNICDEEREADIKSENSDSIYVLPAPEEKREKKPHSSKKTEEDTQSRSLGCTYTLSEERKKQIREDCKKFEEKYTKGVSSNSGKRLEANVTSDSSYPDHDEKVKRMSEYSKPSTETPAQLSLIQDSLNICDEEREADIKSENSDSIYVLPDPEEKREKKPESSKKTEEDTQSRSLGCTYTLSEERRKQIREDCKKFEEKYTKGVSSNSGKRLEQNATSDSSYPDHDKKVKRMTEDFKPSAETPAQLSLIQDPLNTCDAEREADIKSENSDSIYVLPDPEEKREKKQEIAKNTEKGIQSRSLGCTYTLSEERRKQIRENCKRFEEKYTKGFSSTSVKGLEENARADSSQADHDEKVKRIVEDFKTSAKAPVQFSLIDGPSNIGDVERKVDAKSEHSDSIYVLTDSEEKREKKQGVSKKTEADTKSNSSSSVDVLNITEEKREKKHEVSREIEEKDSDSGNVNINFSNLREHGSSSSIEVLTDVEEEKQESELPVVHKNAERGSAKKKKNKKKSKKHRR